MSLFSCFRKSKGFGVLDDDQYKGGIIIPHSFSEQGAVTPKGETEYQYALDMMKVVDAPYCIKTKITHSRSIKDMASKGTNLTIEPHFNSFNGLTSGCEFLVLKGDSESERFARLVIEDFAAIHSQRKLRGDNGIKWITKKDRGYWNLKTAKKYVKVALLTELFFGDNTHDFMRVEKQAEFWLRHLPGAIRRVEEK